MWERYLTRISGEQVSVSGHPGSSCGKVTRPNNYFHLLFLYYYPLCTIFVSTHVAIFSGIIPLDFHDNDLNNTE